MTEKIIVQESKVKNDIRGIRHAITRSFKNGYLDHLYKEVPTNKLFLFDLIEKFI